jgi:hypothetical protein
LVDARDLLRISDHASDGVRQVNQLPVHFTYLTYLTQEFDFHFSIHFSLTINLLNTLSEHPLSYSNIHQTSTFFLTFTPLTLNMAGMDDSIFKRLSPELRNRIYELTFTGSEGIIIQCTKSGISKGPKGIIIQCPIPGFSKKATVSSPNISLTRTCREIRQESLKMYYFLNSITIVASADRELPDGRVNREHIPGWALRTNLIGYERLIGQALLREVRHIKLKLRGFAHDSYRSGNQQHAMWKMSREQLLDVRSRFHPLAHFEVQFKIEILSFDLSSSGNTFNAVWDVDQPVEQLEERLVAADPGLAVYLNDFIIFKPEAHMVLFVAGASYAN